MRENSEKQRPRPNEPEHTGPIWKHPYMLYAALTAVLFVFILLMGKLALEQGWIPNR
jgi:hypothetical protein